MEIKNNCKTQAITEWDIYPHALVEQIRKKLDQYQEHAAIIRAPLQNYFRGKALRCCVWYPHLRPSLQNCNRVVESGLVHTDPKSLGDIIDIEWGEVPPIIHYWNDSWKSFIKSHWLYNLSLLKYQWDLKHDRTR